MIQQLTQNYPFKGIYNVGEKNLCKLYTFILPGREIMLKLILAPDLYRVLLKMNFISKVMAKTCDKYESGGVPRGTDSAPGDTRRVSLDSRTSSPQCSVAACPLAPPAPAGGRRCRLVATLGTDSPRGEGAQWQFALWKDPGRTSHRHSSDAALQSYLLLWCVSFDGLMVEWLC